MGTCCVEIVTSSRILVTGDYVVNLCEHVGTFFAVYRTLLQWTNSPPSLSSADITQQND